MADLKSMAPKEKWEYIWDYYKLHIVGGILALFFLISIIYGQITKVETVFNLTLMGPVASEEKRVALEKDITSLVVSKSDKRKQASINVYQVNGTLSSADGTNIQFIQKFMAQTSVGEIDLVVVDRKDFSRLLEEKTFARLEDYADLGSSEFKNQQLIKDSSSSGTYGIEIGNNKRLQAIGYNTQDKVLAAVVSSKRKDQAAKVMKWLLRE